MWRLALFLLASCGRLAFDAGERDAGGSDLIGSQHDPIVGEGLRLWLELEDGAQRLDSITNQLAECAVCPVPVPGPRGGAGAFAAQACMTFAHDPRFAVQELTIMLWFRVSDATGGATMFGKPFDATAGRWNSFELWLMTPIIGHANTTAGATNDDITVDLSPADSWHHWAATYRFDRKRTYVDGTLRGTDSAPDGPLAYDGEPLRIGCDLDQGVVGEHFTGTLDDIRFYDRELTAAEIALLASP